MRLTLTLTLPALPLLACSGSSAVEDQSPAIEHSEPAPAIRRHPLDGIGGRLLCPWTRESAAESLPRRLLVLVRRHLGHEGVGG